MYVYVVNTKWRPFTGSNNVNNTDAQLNPVNIGIAVEMMLLTYLRAGL